MNCQECQKQLGAYVEGLLDKQQEQDVLLHLETCPQCKIEAEKYTSLQERLVMKGKAFAQKSLVSQVMNRIFQEHNVKVRRVTMITRNRKRGLIFATGVVAIVLILGVTGLLPFFSSPKSGDTLWWLSPPAAWAKEIMADLDKVKGVIWREQTLFVMKDGARHKSSTVTMFSMSHDSYKRSIFDNDQLREIQWYTPQDGGMMQTSIRYDTSTYSILGPSSGSFGYYDPVERMRFYVGLIDKADRLLGTETIDGTECVGFEISSTKYGNNQEDWFDRIWFDVKTKLPVRIEKEKPASHDLMKATISVQDQFDWNPPLPAGFFTPEIPEEFTHAHPDDLRSDEHDTLGGLGMVIAIDSQDDLLTVVSTLPDSSASRYGILKGDKITEIDGESTEEINVEKAIQLLHGEPGTKVSIKIFRPSDQSIADNTTIREILHVKTSPE